MVAFISGILLLFLLLRAIKLFGRMSPAIIARWARRGGFFLIFASLAYLIFAGRGGLFRLFSTSLRNSINPNKFDPLADDFTATGQPTPRRTKVARSAWIEMHLDLDVGGMRGYVLAGPYAGRDLSALSRDDGLKLYDLCRAQDPEGARLLETYFDRRFSGWRQAYQGQGQSGGAAAARAARCRATKRTKSWAWRRARAPRKSSAPTGRS